MKQRMAGIEIRLLVGLGLGAINSILYGVNSFLINSDLEKPLWFTTLSTILALAGLIVIGSLIPYYLRKRQLKKAEKHHATNNKKQT